MLVTTNNLTVVALTLPFADQPWPWFSAVLACVAVVIIGIAKSGFGGGVGIVAVPLFVIAMGPVSGLGTLLPLLIAADIFSLYHHWGTWDKRNLQVLFPGAIAGIAIGALVIYLLGQSDDQKRILGLIIGIICLLYIVAEIIRVKVAPHWKLQAKPISGNATGLAAGVVSTLAHAAGPVTTIYLLGQHLNRQTFIGTAVIFYFVVNSVKLIPYGTMGLINTSTLWGGLVLVPLVPLGTWLGMRLNKWMSDGLFRIIIQAIVLATGLKLVWEGVVG